MPCWGKWRWRLLSGGMGLWQVLSPHGGRAAVCRLSLHYEKVFLFFKEVWIRSHSGFLKELNFYVMVTLPPFGMMFGLGRFRLGFGFLGCIRGSFGLGYFGNYAKQLMQINKNKCIIYKFVKVVYEKKTTYEYTIFASRIL